MVSAPILAGRLVKDLRKAQVRHHRGCPCHPVIDRHDKGIALLQDGWRQRFRACWGRTGANHSPATLPQQSRGPETWPRGNVRTFTARAPFRNCLCVFLSTLQAITAMPIQPFDQASCSPGATVAEVPRIPSKRIIGVLRWPASCPPPGAAARAGHGWNRTRPPPGWFPAGTGDNRGSRAHRGCGAGEEFGQRLRRHEFRQVVDRAAEGLDRQPAPERLLRGGGIDRDRGARMVEQARELAAAHVMHPVRRPRCARRSRIVASIPARPSSSGWALNTR
jgi:hypothetical protein